MKTKVRKWEKFHEKFLSENPDFCLIFYHELKENVIEGIRPCILYLGFIIPADLEKCIAENQEGFLRRKPLSQQEKDELQSKFPQEDIEQAKKVKRRIFRKLKAQKSHPILECNHH